MDGVDTCGNRGPRIGDEGQPICLIDDPLHVTPHIPDESWFPTITSWTDHAFCGETNINRYRARKLGQLTDEPLWNSSAEAGVAEAGR